LPWSPTGDLLAFTRRDKDGRTADIVTINPESGRERVRTTDPAVEELPSFSPNGRQIAFRSLKEVEGLPRSPRLRRLDLDTGKEELIWRPKSPMNSYRHGRPVWSTR
jgi:Tol biopolymer transport system component